MSLEMAHKVILPPKKNYIPQFLKQRDINSYCVLASFFYGRKHCFPPDCMKNKGATHHRVQQFQEPLVHTECETWEPFRGLNQTETRNHKDNKETEHWIIVIRSRSDRHKTVLGRAIIKWEEISCFTFMYVFMMFCKSSSVNVCRVLDRSLIYCMIWWAVYDVHLITGYNSTVLEYYTYCLQA